MSISLEVVGVLSSPVSTSLAHRPAKARLEPTLGLGPALIAPRLLFAKSLPLDRPQRKHRCPAESGTEKGTPRLQLELEPTPHGARP